MPGPSLLIFADDWGRHPSSCQHLLRQLLPRYPAWWLNTIGTRRPRLDRNTLRRGSEKLRQWTGLASAGQRLPDNLHVVNVRMWPWFTSGRDRRINRALLLRQLLPMVRRMPQPVVAVTTLPIVGDLVGSLPVGRWVYYCVDDFTKWPGLDGPALLHMEKRLVGRADVLVAVSETLEEKLSQGRRRVHLLTHGVDLDHWTSNGTSPAASARMARGTAERLAGFERPLVAFWGVVDARMDAAFIEALTNDLERGTVLLAGPEVDPDPATFQRSRVGRLGPLPYGQLPALAREAAVLVMPYANLPVTRAIQPLKLKEYLATGKPTVVRDLPATRPWADCCDLASTPAEFSELVRRRIRGGLPDAQRRARRRLVAEGWPEKARQFEAIALKRFSNEPDASQSHD